MAAPRRRTTIGDVAAAAGVSRATVSRVLNGTGRVDAALADRVRSAAERLRYQPNLTALGLARGFTGMVGVIVPDLANPFFPELLKSIESAAGAEDCRVVVADTDENEEQEVRLVEELSRRCDGLILCSLRMSRRNLRRLAEGDTPLVLANRIEPDMEIPAAAIEIDDVVHRVVRHLADLGHRRIGYLAGPVHSWSNAEREHAVKEAARAQGLRATVVPAGSTTDDGHAAAAALVGPAGGPAKVSAVIGFNDLVTFGALARFAEHGLRAPDDISLVGFDDIPAARFAAPPLSTVRFPKAELGRAAWDLLRDQLAGRRPRGPTRLAPELVLRGSTAPPAGRARP
jgi:DNA-binding LacI/PurR family transcriptional regulator